MSCGELFGVISARIDEVDIRLAFHSHHERHLFSIRRPGRGGVQTWIGSETPEVLSVHIDQVEVWVSPEVGGKDNFFPIRRPGGRKIDGLILSDLFHFGAIKIGNGDLFPSPLNTGKGDFRIVDSLLPRELEDDLIGDSMDHFSNELGRTFVLFSDEVFLFNQIKKMKFQGQIEIRVQKGLSGQ